MSHDEEVRKITFRCLRSQMIKTGTFTAVFYQDSFDAIEALAFLCL